MQSEKNSFKHQSAQSYTCTICDKVLTKKQYKRHIKTQSRKQGSFAHLKSKNGYACKVCQYNFEGRYPTSQLKMHLITYSDAEILKVGYAQLVITSLFLIYNTYLGYSEIKGFKTKKKKSQEIQELDFEESEELKMKEGHNQNGFKFKNSNLIEDQRNQSQLSTIRNQNDDQDLNGLGPNQLSRNYISFEQIIKQTTSLNNMLIGSIEELAQRRPSLGYNHLARHQILSLKQDDLYRERIKTPKPFQQFD